MSIPGSRAAALALALTATACAAGMSVSDDLTGAALGREGKAVALIMATAPNERCTLSYLVLGRREKQGFRALPALITERQNGLTVAEARLDPGEYHVVSYRCSRPGQTAVLGKGEDEGQQILPIYAIVTPPSHWSPARSSTSVVWWSIRAKEYTMRSTAPSSRT
jgi:hypothetical protein